MIYSVVYEKFRLLYFIGNSTYGSRATVYLQIV